MIKERLNLSDEDVKMCKQIGFRTLSLCSIMEMEKMQALAYVRVMIPVINPLLPPDQIHPQRV